jgi:hypothetical protein
MKAFKLIALLLIASCAKIDNKREVIVYAEGYYYNDNTLKYDYKDTEETFKVKVGDQFKKYIVSNPKFTLAGQPIYVRITSDGKEIYNKANQIHNIDLKIE